MSMEKRKKTREFSDEVRHKIVAKHRQSQDHKSIFRDLDVPVSSVHNVIRKFKARGIAANLPGKWIKFSESDPSNAHNIQVLKQLFP